MEENQPVPEVESPPAPVQDVPSVPPVEGEGTGTGTTTTTVDTSNDALVQAIQQQTDFQVAGFNILLGLLFGYIAARGLFDPWR